MIDPTTESSNVPPSPSLADRVMVSLNRLGYYHVQVEQLGGGKIRLIGTVPSHDDRAIVVAAARTVSGVCSVSLKLRV